MVLWLANDINKHETIKQIQLIITVTIRKQNNTQNTCTMTIHILHKTISMMLTWTYSCSLRCLLILPSILSSCMSTSSSVILCPPVRDSLLLPTGSMSTSVPAPLTWLSDSIFSTVETRYTMSPCLQQVRTHYVTISCNNYKHVAYDDFNTWQATYFRL